MDAKEVREDRLLSKPANRGTETKLRIFLKAYAKTGRVNRACEMAGISFVVHYRRLQSDPQYRTTFEEVEQTVAQGLEDRVHELATAGDLQAALALLRRFRPELYRDRASLEVSGSLDLVDRLREARNRVITLRNENLPTGTTG